MFGREVREVAEPVVFTTQLDVSIRRMLHINETEAGMALRRAMIAWEQDASIECASLTKLRDFYRKRGYARDAARQAKLAVIERLLRDLIHDRGGRLSSVALQDSLERLRPRFDLEDQGGVQ